MLACAPGCDGGVASRHSVEDFFFTKYCPVFSYQKCSLVYHGCRGFKMFVQFMEIWFPEQNLFLLGTRYKHVFRCHKIVCIDITNVSLLNVWLVFRVWYVQKSVLTYWLAIKCFVFYMFGKRQIVGGEFFFFTKKKKKGLFLRSYLICFVIQDLWPFV